MIFTGDKVRLKVDIFEEGEDLPPGKIANKGDIVLIKSTDSRTFDYSVAHEGNPGSFGVYLEEIEEIDK